MADSTPNIVLAPRTPTPPPDNDSPPTNGGLGFPVSHSLSDIVYDPASLSPVKMSTEPVPTPSTAYFTPATPEKNSPFNFQTTSMAKSPVVKSVSIWYSGLLLSWERYGKCLLEFLTEYRAATWSQVQAQQCVSSNILGTSSSSASCAT